jgi:hypothetical protein
MAQTSWPFENIDTTETQFSQWARNIGEGVKKGAFNELEVTAPGGGMTVSVNTGQAMVRGHYYSSTASESLTITAADADDPRIDSVVIELDPTANTILLKVLAGTPDPAPTRPALTQTDSGIYQIRLADVQVDAATLAIEPGDITDQRDYVLPQQDLAKLTPNVNAKSANYTLVVEDRGEFITCDGTFTITIPSATFSAGDRVDFVNIGTGVITFAGSGVTVNSIDAAVTIDTQWAGATFFFTSASAGVLIGRLA